MEVRPGRKRVIEQGESSEAANADDGPPASKKTKLETVVICPRCADDKRVSPVHYFGGNLADEFGIFEPLYHMKHGSASYGIGKYRIFLVRMCIEKASSFLLLSIVPRLQILHDKSKIE